LLLAVGANVDWVLHMGERFAQVGLLCEEVLFDWSWESVEWNNYVLCVSDFLELDVGDFFVVDVGWIVGRDITW